MMMKFLIAVAASMAMVAPAHAYTCTTATETLLTDLEKAVAIMEGVNMTAPNEQDVKELMRAGEVLVQNKDAAMYLDDKANNCKDTVDLMRYRSRTQAVAARIRDFYQELMSSPETMMLIFGAGANK